MTLTPASLGNTTQNYIGKSQWNDPYFNGQVDEFRIYRGRLAPDEIVASDVLGPNALLNTSVSVKASRSGGNIVLSWPVAAAGFSVQSSTNLVGGNWLTLTNVPTLAGNTNWQATIPAAGGARFIRLWR